MKKFVIITSSVLAALLVAGLFLPTLIWEGGALVQVDLVLVEENSSRPVREAKIWIVRSGDYHSMGTKNLAATLPHVAGDERGRVKIDLMCGAGGGTFLFWRSGGYVVRHELIIEAPGYRRICTPLANILGGDDWPLRQKRHSRQIWMIRQ